MDEILTALMIALIFFVGVAMGEYMASSRFEKGDNNDTN